MLIISQSPKKIKRFIYIGTIKAKVKAAYEKRKPHSDQGRDYTSNEFRKHLKTLSIRQSFSNPGMPYDNHIIAHFYIYVKSDLYLLSDTLCLNIFHKN